MAKIDGSKIKAGVKKAPTWGTAVQATTDDMYVGTITDNQNVQELLPNQIGSGIEMNQTAIRGSIKPTLALGGDCRYGGYFPVICSQFFGTTAVATLATGEYGHTLTYNSTMNATYLTMAFEDTTTTTREYPSVAVSKISVSTNEIPGILQYSADCLADQLVLSTSTNTNANLANVTLADSYVIAHAPEDTFRLNVSSAAALGSTSTYGTNDVVAITSFNLELMRPQEIVGEIRGTAGNGTPVRSGQGIEGTLTVGLRNMEDHAYWTAWGADTVLKADLSIQGPIVNASNNRTFRVRLPGLQLVQEPSHPITSEGNLPLTLTFRVIAPSSAPTGMSSIYPEFFFINARSTAYLA